MARLDADVCPVSGLGEVMAKKGVVNLKGKQYKTVALRVAEFREAFPPGDGWGIITDLVRGDDVVVIRAAIVNPQDREVATGYAEEVRSNRGVNSTSALENCETSAIGRALAAFGLAGEEYASADELMGALKQQERKARQASHHSSWPAGKAAFFAKLGEMGVNYEALCDYLEGIGRPRPSRISQADRSKLLVWLGGEADAAKKLRTAAAA